MSRPWWRRNRFALPAAAMALLALAWPLSEPARQGWWAMRPHAAHAPGADGWATINGVGFRLAGFGVAPTVSDDEVPAGYTSWRAEVEVRADGDDMRYCDVELEDADGRRFAPGSAYLPRYDDASRSIECGMGDEPSAVVYFLLPADAAAAHVRVVTHDEMPDYWTLPTG